MDCLRRRIRWDKAGLSARTCGLEDPWVAVTVAGCKRLHHPVNLLSFSWETKAPQKLPASQQGCKNTHTHDVKHKKARRRRISAPSEKQGVKPAAAFPTCFESRGDFVTQTSAPAPDSGLRTHANPRRPSGSPGASLPCVKTRETVTEDTTLMIWQVKSIFQQITCCTFLPRSCRWRSCSVPPLCKETRPRTLLATPAGYCQPGNRRPEEDGRRGSQIYIKRDWKPGSFLQKPLFHPDFGLKDIKNPIFFVRGVSSTLGRVSKFRLLILNINKNCKLHSSISIQSLLYLCSGCTWDRPFPW